MKITIECESWEEGMKILVALKKLQKKDGKYLPHSMHIPLKKKAKARS